MVDWHQKLSCEPVSRTTGSLIFADSLPDDSARRFGAGFASRIVESIYADHKRSRKVRRRLEELFTLLRNQGGLGLNFGAGRSAHIERVVNLDVYHGDNVDVVYDGSVIPFVDATFDLVISQEVFEHIASPVAALDEVARVMKSGALLFLQLPFIIGYHSIPGDYWRFSATGIRVFVESTGKFEVVESAMALGHGTGLYRIIVEFVAVTASVLAGFLYRPAKRAAAILFYWVKFFDLLTPLASEPDRIAGGYYVVAVRK